MASELYVETLKGLTTGDNANTITVGSGQTLYAPGHVLQVLQDEASSETDITSSTFVDTGLSVAITPSATSSKVLIFVCLASTGAYEASGNQALGKLRILRGSTEIYATSLREYDYGGSGMFSFANHYIGFLDSPSTTSATTYKVQAKLDSGDAFRIANDGAKMTIIVQEIAG